MADEQDRNLNIHTNKPNEPARMIPLPPEQGQPMEGDGTWTDAGETARGDSYPVDSQGRVLIHKDWDYNGGRAGENLWVPLEADLVNDEPDGAYITVGRMVERLDYKRHGAIENTSEVKYLEVTGASSSTSEGFWARIDDATLQLDGEGGGLNKWTYDWTEVEKTSVGYGGWTALEDGRFGTHSGPDAETDDLGPAYNSIEDINTAVDGHIEGAGVDAGHLSALRYTGEMMPITTGNKVWMHPYTFTYTEDEVEITTTEYWFSIPNGVDGECTY